MRSTTWLVVILFSLTLSPTRAAASAEPASAEHGAHAANEAKPPLLSFDPGAAVWSIIVFGLLVIVLRVTAWKPILQALQQREKFIRDSLEQAKQDREAAERHAGEYAVQLAKARDQAEAVIAEARRDAEVLRIKLKEQAEGEAEAMIARAKRDIELARSTAIKDIYEAGAQLATEAAAKIIGRELQAADHDRIIAESIDQLAARRN